MNQKDWSFKKRLEKQFEKALRDAIERIVATAKTFDTIEDVVKFLTNITHTEWFSQFSQREAQKMVSSISVENAKTWREAARKSLKPGRIFQGLQKEFSHNVPFKRLITSNADIIKTLPSNLAKTITQKAAREAIAGTRGHDLVNTILKEAPDLAKWQAKRIARTEIAKTQATITKVRSQSIGINWYIWRSVKDQRTRESHSHIDGMVCSYNDPPSPERLIGEKYQGNYGPGEIYNCRCYSEPLILLDFVEFPVKVVVNGKIERLSRKRFEALYASS